MVERIRPISESAASNSNASLILAPVRSSQGKIAGENGGVLGARPRKQDKAVSASDQRILSSVTESIGINPRYSMRRPTSAAVGAAIDPLTISPTWLRARYRKVGICITGWL